MSKFSKYIFVFREKKNCKGLDVGDDLMKFVKITTPGFFFFFIFKIRLFLGKILTERKKKMKD
jgi:hypothetical protein